MNVAFQRNIGSFLRSAAAFGATAVTTANDGTPVDGLIIDREKYIPLALSAYVSVIAELTALGDDETLQLVLTASDSADGVEWADLDIGPPDGSNAVTFTSADEGTTVSAGFKAQLGAARRYVRFSVTPTFSASSGDTASILGGVAVIGGFDELPAADYVDPSIS